MWGISVPGIETAGNFNFGKTEFTGTLEVYQGNGTAFAEAAAGYDATTQELTFDMAEAYVDYSSSFWGFRIGAQKTAWGKADGIDITNSVFPKDSTLLFTEDTSLSINAARLSFSGSFFTIDGYWIPFFKGNKLPLEENNPLRKALIPASVTMNMMGTELSLPVGIGKLESPELKLTNGEFGAKASFYLSFCDFSLYGFYGWDKTPLIDYKISSAITINGEYKRMTMFGFDAAFPIGATVLRVENAYFPERALQASVESIMTGGEIFVIQHELMGLAGIDWMPSGWTITAQYYYDVLFNKSDKLERTDVYTHGATLSISKTLLQETLELSLSGMTGLNNFDSVIKFQTKYSITDALKLSAVCYLFLPGPDKTGTYGAFKDLSTIFIKCQYSF